MVSSRERYLNSPLGIQFLSSGIGRGKMLVCILSYASLCKRKDLNIYSKPTRLELANIWTCKKWLLDELNHVVARPRVTFYHLHEPRICPGCLLSCIFSCNLILLNAAQSVAISRTRFASTGRIYNKGISITNRNKTQ